VAGLRHLVRRGVVKAGESAVAILTGHLLKDAETVMRLHASRGSRRNPPIAIEPTVAAVERLLARRR